ncbi:MAG: hypothetical protein KHY19_02110, partial [Coprobacillus cateniformis]|nr:hypothetical protein [Coprobacillus cateniformis]
FKSVLIVLLCVEMILEIAICFILNIVCIHISIYVTLITFYIEQNFNIKSMMNYRLNNIIITLILFSLSLAFRIYVIPMF